MTEPPEETQPAAEPPAETPAEKIAEPAAPPPAVEAASLQPSSPAPSTPGEEGERQDGTNRIPLSRSGGGGGRGDRGEGLGGGKLAATLAPASRPLVKRHHGLVRLTHWANAILLVGMIGSGLQIYSAFVHFGPRGGPYYPNPWDGKPFPPSVRLGGWLAGGLNWHFALAWPFVLTGLLYFGYLVFTGEWRSLLFRPRDVPRAWQMQLYYLRLRKEHPPQGKHNALQKLAYTSIFLLGVLSVLTGFAVYKPTQLSWLTALFGGYQPARYWHFWAVWIFVAFTLVHVTLVFVVDPASLRAMITGWYRGRFPSHD